MKKYVAFLIIAGVLVIAVVAGVVLTRQDESDDGDSDIDVEETASPSANTIVTLEEFGDYQCPPCAQLHPGLKDLKKQLGPQLNFVFRNLPLTSIHRNALAAAQAAEAARMQNRFWEMHDLLYESQSLWAEEKNPRPRFRQFAVDLGLDVPRFEADMDGDQVRFRLEADHAAAVRLGIEGAPTILVNGRELPPEATDAEGIREAIETTLSRGRARPGPSSSFSQ